MTDTISAIVYSFGALFIILDPLLSVPIFTAMTKGQSKAEISRQALIAVAVAGFLMYIFLFFNFLIFDVLRISRRVSRLPEVYSSLFLVCRCHSALT